MKTLLSILTIATLLFIGTTQAAQVTSAGQAISLCKAEAQAQHADYRRSKSQKIKQVRGGYKVNLKVSLADSSVRTVCNVSKDGTLVYALK